MGTKFYIGWIAIAIVLSCLSFHLTRQIQSNFKRRLCRCYLLAFAFTPFPAWVPGEGMYIIPAAMLILSKPEAAGGTLQCI